MNAHAKNSIRKARKTRRHRLEPTVNVKKEWKCNQCSEVFPTSQGRSLHQSLSHAVEGHDVRLKCNVCSKWIHSLWMVEHLKVDHPNQEALDSVDTKCDKCANDNILFHNASDMNQHYLKEHNKPSDHLLEYQCPQDNCDLSFHGKPSLLRHVAEAHRRLTYACDQCIFLSKYRNLMEFHITKIHSRICDESEQFSCDLCGHLKRDLQGHMDRVHWKKDKVSCDKCDCDVEGPEEYREHLVLVHDLSQEQALKLPFPRKREEVLCPTCGKGFGTVQNLKAHISTIHEDTGKFMCDKCDFRTGHKQTLKRHAEAKHLKTNTYHCDMCNYKAHVQDWVKSHVRLVHNKVKPFKCNQCDMAYGYSRDLQKHVEKVHT